MKFKHQRIEWKSVITSEPAHPLQITFSILSNDLIYSEWSSKLLNLKPNGKCCLPFFHLTEIISRFPFFSGWWKYISKYKSTTAAEVEQNFLLNFLSLAEAKILSNKQAAKNLLELTSSARRKIARVIFFLLHFFAVFLNRRFCCSSHRKPHFS